MYNLPSLAYASAFFAFTFSLSLSLSLSIYIYIYIQERKNILKNEQRNRDAAAKKRANTSGVGKSNNYYNHTYTF